MHKGTDRPAYLELMRAMGILAPHLPDVSGLQRHFYATGDGGDLWAAQQQQAERVINQRQWTTREGRVRVNRLLAMSPREFVAAYALLKMEFA